MYAVLAEESLTRLSSNMTATLLLLFQGDLNLELTQLCLDICIESGNNVNEFELA